MYQRPAVDIVVVEAEKKNLVVALVCADCLLGMALFIVVLENLTSIVIVESKFTIFPSLLPNCP